MEYKVITPSFATAWTGSLSDCLHHIANLLSSISDWKSVTVFKAVSHGYSIVKAVEAERRIRNEANGRADEIRQTYEEYGSESFEMFDFDGIDNAVISEVLGQDVAEEYENWIYFNVK